MKMRKLSCLLIGVLWTSSVLGATTPNTVVLPQVLSRGITQFLQGTDVAGTYKTIYTAGVNGSRCLGIFVTSSDTTAAHLLTIQLVNGGVKYGGMSISVPLSGPGFINAVPPLAPMVAANWPGLALDAAANPYIAMASGDTLQATFTTALTAATLINVVANCMDY